MTENDGDEDFIAVVSLPKEACNALVMARLSSFTWKEEIGIQESQVLHRRSMTTLELASLCQLFGGLPASICSRGLTQSTGLRTTSSQSMSDA